MRQDRQNVVYYSLCRMTLHPFFNNSVQYA
jgi:hypothetical protein